MIILPDGTVSINTTAAKVEEMANKIIDNAPVENSVNLISSGAVYSGLKKAGEITSDGGFAAGGGTCLAGPGGAIGLNAATIGGGAVGSGAGSLSGGAIGQAATATTGFAGGWNAKSMASGAAQICNGTNETANTLQFRNFRLVEANGKIPLDRLDVDTTYENASLKPASGTAIAESFTKNYISAGLSQGVTAGERSTAEGQSVSSIGTASHAEGIYTTALGPYSHAEGTRTIAGGNASHAEGSYTIATAPCSHAEGKYNIEDFDGQYIHIVGIGTSKQNRKNAHTIDLSGNSWFAGKVSQEGVPTTSKDLTPKLYVDTALHLKEDVANKSEVINQDSTDVQYATAKAVYSAIQAACYVDSEATV